MFGKLYCINGVGNSKMGVFIDKTQSASGTDIFLEKVPFSDSADLVIQFVLCDIADMLKCAAAARADAVKRMILCIGDLVIRKRGHGILFVSGLSALLPAGDCPGIRDDLFLADWSL